MKNLNLRLIFKATLIAGTLDIIAAGLNFYFKTGKSVTIVLKYIASGVFGKEAMIGGEQMILAGLLLHYLIALVFTLFFAIIYKNLWNWFQNTPLIAIIYGLFVWAVMNLLIVPNSLASKIPFTWSGALTSALILMVCIGYPLAYLFHKNKTH
jgi:FlaA1/EpsC-like NDP-sugar epimerase